MKKLAAILALSVIGCGSEPIVFTQDNTPVPDDPISQGGFQAVGGSGGSGSSTSTTTGTGGDDCSCGLPNAFSACINGQCVIDKCVTGYTDCNSDPADGCEVHTAADIDNCGGCGNVCDLGNAQDACVAGECTCATENGECLCAEPKLESCDNDNSNGCEVNTYNDVNNCGGCGIECKNGSHCSGFCQCAGAPTYPSSHGVSDCSKCLNANCCDQLNDCLDDVGCASTWQAVVSCKLSNPQGCAFSPGNTNPLWISLRDCRMQNNCSACGY